MLRGLTCRGGRLEGWRSHESGGSAPARPFAGTSKLRLDPRGRGWEVEGLRRSPRSPRLLVVPQSSGRFSEQRTETPHQSPEFFLFGTAPCQADLDARWVVVVHISELEVGGEEEGGTGVGREPSGSPASQSRGGTGLEGRTPSVFILWCLMGT